MKNKYCLYCKKWFNKKYTEKKWEETKYCSWNCYDKNRIGKYRNKNHWSWKGDNIGVAAIHIWLKVNYGSPNKCEKCGKNGLIGRKINWALIKGKNYERKRGNFWRLCRKCHIAYDEIKGIRIKKGQHLSLKTEFKKGNIPKNKGKKFVNGHYI